MAEQAQFGDLISGNRRRSGELSNETRSFILRAKSDRGTARGIAAEIGCDMRTVQRTI